MLGSGPVASYPLPALAQRCGVGDRNGEVHVVKGHGQGKGAIEHEEAGEGRGRGVERTG
jgi:hypothetical protein